MTPKNVRYYAAQEERHYITPEDVAAAINAGAERAELQQEVLEVLGSNMGAEDWSLCAFLAAKFEKDE